MFVACSNPNHDEFEGHIARTRKQAFNIAHRLTGNREDAEDMLQEAYLRAYRAFDTYKRERPFENWFFRILGNLLVDSLRRKGKHNPLSLDQPLGEGGNEWALEIPDAGNDPLDLICGEILDEDLENALGKLPADYLTAVELCDIFNYTYAEIAIAMGTSIGTVRSRIHRGRNMLRDHFGVAQTPRQTTKTASRN